MPASKKGYGDQHQQDYRILRGGDVQQGHLVTAAGQSQEFNVPKTEESNLRPLQVHNEADRLGSADEPKTTYSVV